MAAPALSGVTGYGNYATTGGSNTTAVTGSMATTAGRGLFAIFGGQAHGAVTISDNRSNTWVEIGAEQTSTQFGYAIQHSVWYCASNLTGGSGHTVTGVGPTDIYPTIAVFELDQDIDLDQTTTAVDNALPWVAATLTTGVADTLVCACVFLATSSSTGWTIAATGYTMQATGSEGDSGDWDIGLLHKTVASASTAETPSINGTGIADGENALIRMVSFKAVGDGATTTTATAAAGAATVSAAGASFANASATGAACAATVSAVGLSTAAATGSAAGVASVSGAASSLAEATITPEAGSATVSAAGSSSSSGQSSAIPAAGSCAVSAVAAGPVPSVQAAAPAPVLGSGEARLVFFPSQASIDAKARREIAEKWIAEERAITRKLKGRGKRKKPTQATEPARSFAEVPPPVLEVVEVAAQREQQERRQKAEKRAVELAMQAFFY